MLFFLWDLYLKNEKVKIPAGAGFLTTPVHLTCHVLLRDRVGSSLLGARTRATTTGVSAGLCGGLQISCHILGVFSLPVFNFCPGLMGGGNESSFSTRLAAKGLPTWWTLAGRRGFSGASWSSGSRVLAPPAGCWLRTSPQRVPPVEKHLACFPQTAPALLTAATLIECSVSLWLPPLSLIFRAVVNVFCVWNMKRELSLLELET